MSKQKDKKSENTKPGSSSVKSCSCKHDYQDKIYGNGKRLKIVDTKGAWNCTVCGRS